MATINPLKIQMIQRLGRHHAIARDEEDSKMGLSFLSSANQVIMQNFRPNR
jgi:hypothetical protein